MAYSNIFENNHLLLRCIRANVVNILREYRRLGLGPHSPDNIQQICREMDEIRTKVYKMVVNSVPVVLTSVEEIEILSEMIDMLLDTFNEVNPEELYTRIYG
ncbi:hypothetical protein KR222_003308 [Zaprionus bogoriensis]|nr:hypothetical protein KR222_003308 [Zaprionus bogoriensis]